MAVYVNVNICCDYCKKLIGNTSIRFHGELYPLEKNDYPEGCVLFDKDVYCEKCVEEHGERLGLKHDD